MHPEQPININEAEAKNLRLVVTVGLVLLLVAIVGAYIYFGMQFAKRSDSVEQPTSVNTVQNPTTEDIMKALESAPVASPEDTKAIMEALEEAPVEPTANQEDILRALDHPGV